jgi:hypothetical protein
MGILPMRIIPNMGKMPMPRFAPNLHALGGTPVLPCMDLQETGVGEMIRIAAISPPWPAYLWDPEAGVTA